MAAYTTIDNPELYFQIKLYTGDASSTSHTLDGDENMQPDLAWFKSRSRSDNSRIVDALRGTNSIKSNTDDAEVDSGSDGFTSLDSDGFTLNGSGGGGEFNAASGTYVTWCWKESATSGFDIVTYTGNGSNRDISHSAGAAPHWMMVKNRTGSDRAWNCYHDGLGADKRIFINTTDSVSTSTTSFTDAPTASVMKLGTNTEVNENTTTYVAYVFAPIQGFSKFGSYTGNGNANGTFVYTGFRPAYVICKNTSGTGNWGIKTAKSQAYNGADVTLFANSTGAESAFSDNKVDLLSNGFKILTASSDFNTSGSTYIYMAFAEAPLVNSNGAPCNAR